MGRAAPTKEDLTGKRFGRLVILGRSDQRGSRGARTVPLWECRCDCGAITYKATDTLTNPEVNMCTECLKTYAPEKMREKAGFVNGTQISRIKNPKPVANNTSGCRGVYLDKNTGKWRVRLKFQGKLMSFGSYVDFDDAVLVRKKAEQQIYGDFLENLKEMLE